VPEYAYRYRRGQCSLPLGSIASFDPKPGWYSPGAAQLSAPYADLCLTQFLETSQRWECMENLWMTSLLGCSSMLVRNAKMAGSEWHFTLMNTGSVGHLAWPARHLRDMEGGCSSFAVDVSERGSPVHMLFVLDFEDWEARALEFKSPLWWLLRYPAERAQYDPQHGRCYCVAGEPGPLLKVCAREAFMGVERAVLDKLAQELHAEIPAAASLYDLVFGLVRHVLECDEKEACRICAKRTYRPPPCQTILEVEEADEIMDKTEREDFKKTKEVVQKEAEAFKQFVAAQAARREQLFRAEAKAAAKAKPKAKPGGKAKAAPPPMVLPQGELTQSQVKTLAPPGSFVWRSRRGSWQQHTPPHARSSRAWLKYGEREAAVGILQDAWRLHLGDRFLSVAQCPVQGLFAEGAGDSLFASGAAASSG
jgi:hypothetical protein